MDFQSKPKKNVLKYWELAPEGSLIFKIFGIDEFGFLIVLEILGILECWHPGNLEVLGILEFWGPGNLEILDPTA